jgi:hypothetical protein
MNKFTSFIHTKFLTEGTINSTHAKPERFGTRLLKPQSGPRDGITVRLL